MNLNNHLNDYVSPVGVRICAPLYVDLTQAQRKELLNAVRTAFEANNQTRTPPSQSGISVTTNVTNGAQNYLGCDLNVFRGVIFQRGGIPADLILRAQHMSGYEVVTPADIDKALKHKVKAVKEYITNNPYGSTEATV